MVGTPALRGIALSVETAGARSLFYLMAGIYETLFLLIRLEKEGERGGQQEGTEAVRKNR